MLSKQPHCDGSLLCCNLKAAKLTPYGVTGKSRASMVAAAFKHVRCLLNCPPSLSPRPIVRLLLKLNLETWERIDVLLLEAPMPLSGLLMEYGSAQGQSHASYAIRDQGIGFEISLVTKAENKGYCYQCPNGCWVLCGLNSD